MAKGDSKIKFFFQPMQILFEKYEWCAKVECEITPFDEFQCWFHAHCLARAGDIDISGRGNWGCHVSLGCWAAEGNYPACVRHSPARKGVGPSWIVDDGRTKETDADGSVGQCEASKGGAGDGWTDGAQRHERPETASSFLAT